MKIKPNDARKILKRYQRNKQKLEAGEYKRPCHIAQQTKFTEWVEANREELEELAAYHYKFPGRKKPNR